MWDFIWNDLLINPMINGLIVLSRILFDNFGLAIIALTIIVRGATLPLTLRQLHSGRRMQALQPKIQDLQKKYKDPKRRQQEMMKLYKTEGVNPIGCLGPMLIQMPIWLALYAVLARTVGGTPERTVELASRLYSWSFIQEAVPLPTNFLWLDLGQPNLIMVVFVGVTTWLQTKLSLTQTSMSSPQAAQTQTMMLWMMPVMFAWFTISVPSGLAVYWTVSNIIGIVMNYFVYGWNDRPWTDIFAPSNTQSGPRKPKPTGSAALTDDRSKRATPAPEDGADERQSDAQSGNKRKERRRGGSQSAPTARSRPVSGRRRNR
ncbi:MAG: YidC/Oxa1 family membrane protein insertase [Dehalococcoidia bacterium]